MTVLWNLYRCFSSSYVNPLPSCQGVQNHIVISLPFTAQIWNKRVYLQPRSQYSLDGVMRYPMLWWSPSDDQYLVFDHFLPWYLNAIFTVGSKELPSSKSVVVNRLRKEWICLRLQCQSTRYFYCYGITHVWVYKPRSTPLSPNQT